MAFQRALAEYEFGVHGHLEDAAARRDDLDALDVLLVLREDLGRQTDGPIRVASDGAVFDAYLHGVLRVRRRRYANRVRTTSVLEPAPPRPADGGGGGGWAWLITARGVIEAQLIRGLLEVEGIVPVRLDATDPSPGAWLFLSGNVNALVRVFVPRSLLDAARLVLLEAGWETTAPQPERKQPAGRWTWIVAAAVVIMVLLAATWRGIVTR